MWVTFGKSMYLEIDFAVERIAGDQRYVVHKNILKTFAWIVAAVYICVILFTLLYLQCMENI